MHTLRSVTAQPVGLVLGFTIASLLFLAAFGLALTTGRVLATHDDPAVVHACVNPFTGQARFVPDGQAPNCNANEIQVDLGSGAAAADVEARVAALEERQAEFECIQSEAGANSDVDNIVFTGCNVQVVNGLNSTLTTNEVGNLIVGYNEDYMIPEDRSGSHNLVVGPNHTYSSFGGLVAGISNNVTARYATVSGGNSNTASGPASSVNGGQQNTASGVESSISGGVGNDASGDDSSVSGGNGRSAPGVDDWVAGSLFEDN